MGNKESSAGAALVGIRWAKATAEEKAANAKKLSEGRWKGSTKAERSAAASRAAKARWAKAKRPLKNAAKKT